ncbi:MAG TPA: hypothetical protein PLZ68_05620 [Ferruginibacter sp.]|nr:hypothetical protein [Ferruginibacter sp.]
MKLPLHIAKKLLQLLLHGESIASSTMQHPCVTKMLEDGLLQKKQVGKTKALLFIPAKENAAAYLTNHFGINNLEEYINVLESEEQSRAINIIVSGNSKLQPVRTFTGFLVNSYQGIHATINDKPICIHPAPGTYTFIHDIDNFIPDQSVSIVGIENPENFRQIEKHRLLFTGIQPLFVSRYPQSKDLIKWLSSIPNNYLHFGDLDFAGIEIYETAFKKQLGKRASFFVPENIEQLLQKFGNRDLFNRQYNPGKEYGNNAEPSVRLLVALLLKYKKVLEQEIFNSEIPAL